MFNINITQEKTMIKTYKIHYTADVWMSVEIEASSKKEAEELFSSGEHYEQGYHPVEEGMENVKIDMIEDENGNKL
tara:strand:- start:408 stop:635 length:228 start_codon:yes stop_codon:yes gene_type:complete